MPIHKPCIAWTISSNNNVLTNLPFALNLPNGESQASSAMNSLASNNVPLQTTLVSVQFIRRVTGALFITRCLVLPVNLLSSGFATFFHCDNTLYT